MLQIKRSELKQLAQNKLGNDSIESQNIILVQIATAMAARVSYTVIGEEKEFGYDKQLELYNRLVNQKPLHASPMEHCAKVMNEDEYESWFRGAGANEGHMGRKENQGWCKNYKGFIQLRQILENGKTNN